MFLDVFPLPFATNGDLEAIFLLFPALFSRILTRLRLELWEILYPLSLLAANEHLGDDFLESCALDFILHSFHEAVREIGTCVQVGGSFFLFAARSISFLIPSTKQFVKLVVILIFICEYGLSRE